jgi:hypothetical protein
MRAEAKVSVRTLISHPVGRAVQAAACKAAEVGAIPTRDSNLRRAKRGGRLPTIASQRRWASDPIKRATVGRPNRNSRRATDMPVHFRNAKSRCRSELHRSGRGGSTPPSRRDWVANFDSEVPALNRRERGANPRRPTILRSEPTSVGAERRMPSIGLAKEGLFLYRLRAMDGRPCFTPT